MIEFVSVKLGSGNPYNGGGGVAILTKRMGVDGFYMSEGGWHQSVSLERLLSSFP